VVPTPPPIVNGFSPDKGRVGTGVTIAGSNFSRATAVQFNGVNAKFRIESDTTITTTVPAKASDGPITVINRGGSATGGYIFDVEDTPLPANLAFIDAWVEPIVNPKPGSPLVVKFSFINNGASPTGRFTIRIIGSEELYGSSSGYTDVRTPSYVPGGVDFVYWAFPSGLSEGYWAFYAYLDNFNEVAEVSETDNSAFVKFHVT
jgi:hypothetical protein